MDQPTTPKRVKPVGNRRKTRADLPANPDLNKLDEKTKWHVFTVCRDELRKMKAEGVWDGDPETWHPARPLVRLIEDPACPQAIKVLCIKELMPHVAIDLATQARIDANMDGPAHITVHIESYAAGSQSAAAALEPPRRVDIPALDVVASDPEVVMHRNSPVTPDVNVPKYREYRVENGEAVEEGVVTPEPLTDDVVVTDTIGNTYTIKRSV
jgi:hypothetical protein